MWNFFNWGYTFFSKMWKIEKKGENEFLNSFQNAFFNKEMATMMTDDFKETVAGKKRMS